MERAREALPASAKLSYAADAYEAARDADAVLILTEWREFAKLDLERLKAALKFPIVIDGRNLYPPEAMATAGFTYVSMGRPAAQPARPEKPKQTVL